jgi:hypothetical protein
MGRHRDSRRVREQFDASGVLMATEQRLAIEAQQDRPRVPVANPCNCIGPQDGQPLCPCAMHDVVIRDGRYVLPERDLGPV